MDTLTQEHITRGEYKQYKEFNDFRINSIDEDIREIKSDVRELRKEFHIFKEDVASEFKELHKEVSGLGERIGRLEVGVKAVNDKFDSKFDALDKKINWFFSLMAVAMPVVLFLLEKFIK